MQLPAQGKFDEAPGWALRPAWGQQYGRSQTAGDLHPAWGQQYGRSQTAAALRPDSPWSRQNRSPQWGRQRMLEVRGYLRGLGGAIPTMMSEPDYAKAAADAKYYFEMFFPRYSNQYWQQSKDFADAVIAELQSRGYELRNLTLACASSDCFPAMYSFVMAKNGRSMEASAGNPIRFNSPSEEADFLDAAFGGGSSSDYWSGGPASVSEGDIGTLIANATTTQTANTATTTTYRRDVQLLAPDGYKTGGRFTLKIWGLPNQTVEIEAWQNGQSHGRTAYGATNAQGYYEISGSWQPEHAGRWQENVYVGGEIVGRLDFELTNPSQPPGNVTVTPTTPELPAANQPPQPGSGTKAPDTGGQTPGVVGQPAGSGLPMLLLIGGAAALLLSGGKK